MRFLSSSYAIALLYAVLLLGALVIPSVADEISAEETYPAERIKSASLVVWYGKNETMTVEQFAAYCAPVLWFSPDEPLLREHTGKDITIPEPFPFEDDPGRPVVYFRLRHVIERSDEEGPGYEYTGGEKGEAVIHLRRIVGVDLDFFFYYSEEEGLNAHQHDVESVEMKVAIARGDTEETSYAMVVTRAKGKAHGVLWYDNTLDCDEYTRFPLHVLVEEAKHASCPDKNGDGLYTPGFDVNTRINDAWGVRDIIRGGTLFSASWQAWMAKMRFDDTRVFPPLPENSRRRGSHTRDGVYAPDNAVYLLRPFPTDEKAGADLKHFISDKGYPDWPEIDEVGSVEKFGKWIADETWVKSFSLALRLDGNIGISFMFPFFIVHNLEDPIGGGYILHRIYLSGQNLDDFGYTAVYTPSASRWIDPYFAIGFENRHFDQPDGSTSNRYDFQFETGFKFRVNVVHTPLKLVRKLGTDFWGFRFGVRYFGVMNIEELGYVFEFGAGSF
ncbi:MAG: hypothetical protein IH969_02295 [Candidatus Krumholzibacteriota bacterium]|nr:hypothetical protein [Candidatus Krumholzibacteriota bacterium]